jgi:hypothetical protein
VNLYEGKANLVNDPDAAEVVATFGVELKEYVDARRAERKADKLSADRERKKKDVTRVSETVVIEGPVEYKYESEAKLGDWWVRVNPDGSQDYICKAHDPVYVAPKGAASIPGHNRHHMPGAKEHMDNMRIRASAANKARREAEAAAKAAEEVPQVARVQVQEVPEAVPLEPSTPASKDQRQVISRRQWLARETGSRGGSGLMYASPYVDVVVFSDGTEEYECRQCHEWRSNNPRSVAAHSSKAHGPITFEKTLVPTTEYETSGVTRGQSPARRLANDIISALDTVDNWQQLDRMELAVTLAEAMVSARPDRAPAEPLTDAEVLQRITSLLDRGQTASLHRQVETMAEALRAAQAMAAEAQERADKTEANMTALRDMLNESLLSKS